MREQKQKLRKTDQEKLFDMAKDPKKISVTPN